ncbi:MAG: ATP-dependent helicase [Propionivibrio sp.]|jgi:DNA helicase-2/ATP-dependent DNA helicase PcrA|nr:ATP-dependent helicase [Propionivibrio sp.]
MAEYKLSEAQQAAVESDAPVLCCACPGSGKTRVLIAKVRHILRTHPDPYVVMTTFSREAADEMLKRIKEDARISNQLDRLTIGTFHSLALRQIKETGKVGKILSEIEARYLISRCLHETGLKLSLEEADAYIAHCKSDREFAAQRPELARLTDCYKKHQAALGSQDFTDILLRANQLMADRKVKPIRATHVLADEFQDADILQFDWLMHHAAQNPVLCAVGDDDQSIYAFRRSLGYRGMMDFVAATGATIINLDTNYRSTEGIVTAASKLIAYNIDRVPKKIKAGRGPGQMPKVICLAKGESQALRIVHALDEVCARNPVPEPLPECEPYRFGVLSGQAAVLARTNAQLDALEQVFRSCRVPYFRSGRTFWDAQVLQVYVAMLESLIRKDGMGLEIGLRWAKVSDRHIRQLNELAGGSMWNYIDPKGPIAAPATGSAVFDSLVTSGRGWAAKLVNPDDAKAAEGPIHGVAAWMSGVMSNRLAHDEDGNVIQTPGRREIRELDRLQAARDTLVAARGSLSARIRKVQQNDNRDIPRVILSTFHASKGLEWTHVYLVDVYEGSVPKIAEGGSDEEVAEERRVFYVALTRARDSLTIYTRSDMPPSEFLRECELTWSLPANNEEQQLESVTQ